MRRRRVSALVTLAIVVAVVIAVLASGGKDNSGNSSPTLAKAGTHGGASNGRVQARATAAIGHVSVTRTGTLPSALQDASVVAVTPDVFLVMGGLDQGEVSHDEVLKATSAGATVIGTLPTALHDACATPLGGDAYLFGGGQSSSFSAITKVSPSGVVVPAGVLPTPASDVSCVTVGEMAYVVGGYTSLEPLRTILVWRPGAPARVVARLPKPLRYAALAVTGQTITIAGGTSGEEASSDIYRFDSHSGALTRIGRLPHPLTHAAAASVGETMLVFGGRSGVSTGQTSEILAIAPSGQVKVVGALPKPMSDMAAVVLEGRVVLAGGRDGEGHVQDSIFSAQVAR